jgi:cytochrome c oxidase subunit 5a
MSSTSLLRIAARAQPSTFFRANGLRSLAPRSSNALYAVPALIATSGSISNFSTSSVRLSDKDGQEGSHHEESFEEFTARYVVPNWHRELLSMFCTTEKQMHARNGHRNC